MALQEQKEFNFSTFLEEALNPTQKEAVLHTRGSLLVIAGAGSGKTRVITARITNLLQQEDVHPAHIIALTFTNKAAREMKERIISFVGINNPIPFIGTFHSYCLYLLKTNRHLLPFEEFSILDEDDKRSLLTKLLKKSPLYKKQTPQQLSYQISLLKNQCADPEKGYIHFAEQPELQELITAYEREKKKSNCFDFDDLMLQALQLFSDTTFQEQHHNKVRHILIDEYQDTNVVQHMLLKKMGLTKKTLAVDSICVVGDEDQSIYSWRGATVDNIVHFTQDFKKTKIIKIEQNYRSKQPILHVANNVIKNNSKRNKKNLWSERAGRDCVRGLRCLSGYQEADIIARYCKLMQTHKKLSSVTLLYRTHFQSRTLEEALIKHSIPYHLVGGIRFYERKEIKDLISYLRLIANPLDRVAFTRIINCPLRGLGEKFVEQCMEEWDEHFTFTFKELLEHLIQTEKIPTAKQLAVKEFLSLFGKSTKASHAAETISHIVNATNYSGFLKRQHEKEEAHDRISNIKELLNAAHHFAAQNKKTIEEFLDEVSLLQEHQSEEEEEEQAGVTLMTLHAAKGLEFDNVIISGLEEGLFPSSRSINDKEKLEEERRLLYVGITRARNRLLLTHARYRQTYGTMEEVSPSRFLSEVPERLCPTTQAGSWQGYEAAGYFSQWLGLRSDNPEVMTFASFIPAHKKPESKIVQKLTKTSSTSGFKKFQTVKHKTFGVGVIKTIEEKHNKTIVTAQFKIGLKKLDASFLESV